MNMHNETYYLKDKSYTKGFPFDGVPFGKEDLSSEEKEETKLGSKYGLHVAKAIEHDWFGGDDCLFLNRQAKFNELRNYAMGNQSTDWAKDVLCFEGQQKWTKLDWEPLKFIPKFVDEVVNGVQERLYNLKAEAIDTVAANKRKDERNKIKKEMISKDFLDDIQKLFGIDAFTIPKDKLPRNQEELDVYIETEFRLPIEIAIEKVTKLIFNYNDLDTISTRQIRDLVILGIAGGKHYIDPLAGIKINYVDPEFTVHSYNENPDFKGAYYFGEVSSLPISELKRMFSHNDIDWKKVKNESNRFYGHLQKVHSKKYKDDDLDNFPVQVLFFSYQTSKEIVFKKKIRKGGAFKMIRRDHNYLPPDKDWRQKKEDGCVDTWMEGVLVLGTDVLLEWKESSNMVRPKGLLHSPMSNFIMYAPKYYEGKYDSLVERMIAPEKQFFLEHMKLQHLISEINPDGLHFDVEGLSDIDLGDGGTYNAKEAIRLFKETGNTVGRSKNEPGDRGNPKPIQPNFTSGQSDKIRNIITAMNFYMKLMVDCVGGNQQSTNPDSDALVGVQKLASLNSNLATRHIRDSALKILQKTGIGVLNRLKDAWKYSEFKEFLLNGLGKADLDVLEALNDFSVHDLALVIELKPDAEEWMKLMEDVNIALKNGEIKITDKIDIMNVGNLKEAGQILKIRIKRYEEQKQQMEMMKIKANEESQINISNASTQGKMQADQLKSQLKIAEIKAQSEANIIENEQLARQKSILMDKEYALLTQKENYVQSSKMSEKQYMEDRKDDRERMKATHQSEQSYQRKNNLPPQNFESKFDNVDAIEI